MKGWIKPLLLALMLTASFMITRTSQANQPAPCLKCYEYYQTECPAIAEEDHTSELTACGSNQACIDTANSNYQSALQECTKDIESVCGNYCY